MTRLVFLKLGGSVITDKDHANTADIERIDTIAHEIALALHSDPELSLIIGHGSGSFGHHAAKKYNTRQGVGTPQEWKGFSEVASRARELNQILINRLIQAGISVVSISPFSGINSRDRKILSWDIGNLQTCMTHRLVPVIYGDVIFDQQLGGTIFSTEELFVWLAEKMLPDEILLAGLEDGVWEDYPNRTHLIMEINPDNAHRIQQTLQESASTDVTGGMRSKVEEMIALVKKQPTLEVQIFSGRKSGNIFSALTRIQKGTVIRNRKG